MCCSLILSVYAGLVVPVLAPASRSRTVKCTCLGAGAAVCQGSGYCLLHTLYTHGFFNLVLHVALFQNKLSRLGTRHGVAQSSSCNEHQQGMIFSEALFSWHLH